MTFRMLLPPAALGAAVLLAAGAAPAIAQVPASPDPTKVQAGGYRVEPSHTRVLFSLSHMGFTTWYGDFTGASGVLRLDPQHPSAARLDVTVPVGSVSTTNAKLDDELKSKEWLDAGRFPTARFVSRSVVSTGPGRADVTGDFTLHGVTKPLTLHVRFNGAGVNPIDKNYTAGFEARGSFKRSAFGVTTYVPMIGDEVELILSGAFVKQDG